MSLRPVGLALILALTITMCVFAGSLAAATPRCGPGGALRMSSSNLSTSTTSIADGHPVDVEAPVSRPVSVAVVSIRGVQYDFRVEVKAGRASCLMSTWTSARAKW